MSGISDLDSVSGLVAFVAAVEAGGFAPAGRKLGVSASAVGKAVGRIETRLGVKLLQRTTRSIALTAEGELLYERSARILEDMREAENAIRRAQSGPRGRLRVSVPTVIGRRLIVPALSSFLDGYPDIDLDLSLDDRIVDVVEEGFDIVVRLGELRESGLIARRIAPHRFITCGAPSYFAAHGMPETPADLANHRCVRYRFPTTGRLEHWAFSCERGAETLGRGLALNDGEALCAAALSGLGVVQAPSYLVAGEVKAGRLQAVLEDYTAPRGDVWLVWPPARAVVPRVRVFIEFMTGLLARNGFCSPEA
jgi:DNA-binding transcriptional LysR family regulator